ncbi:MAG: glycyl-radical enzyme activating protein [Oscillospiraceae bacterium]
MNEINLIQIQRFSLNDGPGIRTTLFFKGCNLSCPWCANPESQSAAPQLLHFGEKCVGCQSCVAACPQKAVTLERGKIRFHRKSCDCCGKCVEACMQDAIRICGKTMSVGAASEILLRDKDYYEESGGGITFSGGEPLLQPEGLKALAKNMKRKGIHTALETAADVPLPVFLEAIQDIDLLLVDVKSGNAQKLWEFTRGNGERIYRNLEEAVRLHKNIIARIPVIPAFNFDDESMAEIFSQLEKIGITKVDLLPYHLMGRKKYGELGREYPFAGNEKSLQKEELVKFKNLAQKYHLTATISGK